MRTQLGFHIKKPITLRGKNGISGTGRTLRTAKEHVESYQKVQLWSRGLPRGTVHSAWQGHESQRKRQVLTDRTLWALEQHPHTQASLTTKSWERFCKGWDSLRRKEIKDHRQSHLCLWVSLPGQASLSPAMMEDTKPLWTGPKTTTTHVSKALI